MRPRRAAAPRPGGRSRPGVLLVLALLGGCTVVTPAPAPPTPRIEPGPPPDVERGVDVRDVELRPVRTFPEVRAVWVVRFTMTSEAAVRAMIDEAEAAGINTLLLQVRGRADAFYRSDIEPPGESMRGPEDFDPLALAVEEAHRRGMAVHAWVNTHLVWGPTERPESPRHLVNEHPEWLAVPRGLGKELVGVDPRDPSFVRRLVEDARARSRFVEGIYSSPSHPAVQDRVHAVWMDLARRYDLDGIHFDYIRFPSAEYDYSIGALERFRLWMRTRVDAERFDALDDAYRDDLYAFVDGAPELWAAFRREVITRLVERIYRDVKAIAPRMVVSAAVIADRRLAYDDRFQDWAGWLDAGILDIAVPMAYTADEARFERLVEDARAAAGVRTRVWAGIGAYLNTPDATLGMIDIARDEDAGGLVIFSYDWAVGEGRGDPANPLLRRIARERFNR